MNHRLAAMPAGQQHLKQRAFSLLLRHIPRNGDTPAFAVFPPVLLRQDPYRANRRASGSQTTEVCEDRASRRRSFPSQHRGTPEKSGFALDENRDSYVELPIQSLLSLGSHDSGRSWDDPTAKNAVVDPDGSPRRRKRREGLPGQIEPKQLPRETSSGVVGVDSNEDELRLESGQSAGRGRPILFCDEPSVLQQLRFLDTTAGVIQAGAREVPTVDIGCAVRQEESGGTLECDEQLTHRYGETLDAFSSCQQAQDH